MFRRTCVVKYVDHFGVEHSTRLQADSLFEAAICGLYKLDSFFWTEDDVFNAMEIMVEVYDEPTIHTVKIEKLKQWVKTQGKHPHEERKKEELRKLLFGTNK